MNDSPPVKILPAVHGGLILLLLVLPMYVRDLAQWPWYFLVPLGVYGLVVVVIAALRRSATWVRVGNFNRMIAASTAGLILITSATLVLYYYLFRPDLQVLRDKFPAWFWSNLILAGILFATLNAFLEEIIFRGILQEALDSQVGRTPAVLIQGLVFGLGHAQGYPPGPVGVVLAAVYGCLLGILRIWSGGLLAPFIAHVFADATIFWIVATQASRAA